jgi:hypothetical protein
VGRRFESCPANYLIRLRGPRIIPSVTSQRYFVKRDCLVPNARMSPYELQSELLAGLTPPTSDLDLAYDFFGTSGVFFSERDEYPESVEDLTPEQLREYAKWLRKTGIELEIRDDPFSVPPAYFFIAPRRLPEGTWLTHHTDMDFERFSQGALMEGLHLSTWRKSKPVARKGEGNLDDEISLYERVFAFAYEPSDDPSIARDGSPRQVSRHKYGQKLMLFQTDAAVSAWHPGDDEQQAIFPVGSEYNVHRIYPEHDHWEVEIGDEMREFRTIDEVIAAIEAAS